MKLQNIIVTDIPITGLINGTSYDFRVAAVNQNGLGLYAYTEGIIPIGSTTPTITPTETPIPTPTAIFIGATNISDLVTYGTFVTTPSGDNPEETSKISVGENVTINIGDSGNLNTVYLPQGTDITEDNNQFFNTNQLSAEIIDKNTIPELGLGFIKEAVLQWGIPNTTLIFSNPITINIYVGSDLSGRTLSILRSPTGSSGWTSEGIVAPATCVVTTGYCQFSSTKASYFTAASYEAPVPTPTPTQTPQQNSNNENSSSNTNSTPGPSVCSDAPPADNPNLFEIKTVKGSVNLFYTPSLKATSYAVIYGLKKGDERFGTIINTVNENKGVQNADIHMLNPKITYYFKVAAINGCTISPWSEWVPAKANRKSTIYKYKTIIKNKLRTLVNIFK